VKPRRRHDAGWVRPGALPKGPNGRVLCRQCRVEVPVGRRTFCSGDRATFEYRTGDVVSPGYGCVHEFMLGSNPGYVRKLVWARDKGVCALCGDVAPGVSGHHWQADHTVPVAEGGGLCGLEGYRTLCTPCHKRETAALAKRRAGRHKDRHG
jgi:5-methylcytosine-specific restriction protein A